MNHHLPSITTQPQNTKERATNHTLHTIHPQSRHQPLLPTQTQIRQIMIPNPQIPLHPRLHALHLIPHHLPQPLQHPRPQTPPLRTPIFLRPLCPRRFKFPHPLAPTRPVPIMRTVLMIKQQQRRFAARMRRITQHVEEELWASAECCFREAEFELVAQRDLVCVHEARAVGGLLVDPACAVPAGCKGCVVDCGEEGCQGGAGEGGEKGEAGGVGCWGEVSGFGGEWGGLGTDVVIGGGRGEGVRR